MTSPRLSIIIPAYNSESTIEACVRSVLEQSLPEVEAIVVDDGSTDRTPERLRALAAGDARVRVFSPGHGGVSAARSYGIEQARGEWIGFLDSDDTLTPDCAEYALSLPMADEAVYMMIWPHRELDARTPILKEGNVALRRVRELAGAIGSRWLYYVGGKLFRRSLLLRSGVRFRNELSYSEDTVFALDYINACAPEDMVVLASRTVYHYTRSPNGLRLRGIGRADHLPILKQGLERLCRQAALSETDRRYLEGWWHYRRMEIMLDIGSRVPGPAEQYRLIRPYLHDPVARRFLRGRHAQRCGSLYHRVLLTGSASIYVLYDRIGRALGRRGDIG